MRSYTINTEPVKVSVNGISFELLKTDAQSQADIMQYISKIVETDISSADDVHEMLRTGCELIDSILGGGACYSIFGETPISMAHICALLVQIGRDCASAYHQYLKIEYLEG